MAMKATDLIGRDVEGSDGVVGRVEDLYFDDERWVVRHLVVRCGDWLGEKHVLLPPGAVESGDSEGAVRVRLTRRQIEDSPPVDTEQPVSRLYEQAHAHYYGYPYYWTGPSLWGAALYPGVMPMPASEVLPKDAPGTADIAADAASGAAAAAEAAERSHLRSAREVVGYRVDTPDGDAGTVDDLLIDDRTWAIEHIVADTRPWWPGGQVLVAPQSTSSIDWANRTLRVDTGREALKAGPAAR